MRKGRAVSGGRRVEHARRNGTHRWASLAIGALVLAIGGCPNASYQKLKDPADPSIDWYAIQCDEDLSQCASLARKLCPNGFFARPPDTTVRSTIYRQRPSSQPVGLDYQIVYGIGFRDGAMQARCQPKPLDEHGMMVIEGDGYLYRLPRDWHIEKGAGDELFVSDTLQHAVFAAAYRNGDDPESNLRSKVPDASRNYTRIAGRDVHVVVGAKDGAQVTVATIAVGDKRYALVCTEQAGFFASTSRECWNVIDTFRVDVAPPSGGPASTGRSP